MKSCEHDEFVVVHESCICPFCWSERLWKEREEELKAEIKDLKRKLSILEER